MDGAPPATLVEEVRNGRVQATHVGHAVLLAPDGSVVRSWGDAQHGMYWRSAPKAIQAQPFVAVMDRFGFEEADLALACASHSTEQRHVDRARAMLERVGLQESDLACGGHHPLHTNGIQAPAGGYTDIHNNCSGKHAAMLAACIGNDWPTAGYHLPDHPLQKHITDLIAEAAGVPAEARPVAAGVDGCSVPTFWLPVASLARAYQWLETTSGGRRALDAMADHPEMVAGEGRFCTEFMRAGRGDLVGKVGAAGVYVALHRPTGAALAVKAESGVMRAAECTAAAIAARAGWLDDRAQQEMAAYITPKETTWHGQDLGTWNLLPDTRS